MGIMFFQAFLDEREELWKICYKIVQKLVVDLIIMYNYSVYSLKTVLWERDGVDQ